MYYVVACYNSGLGQDPAMHWDFKLVEASAFRKKVCLLGALQSAQKPFPDMLTISFFSKSVTTESTLLWDTDSEMIFLI